MNALLALLVVAVAEPAPRASLSVPVPNNSGRSQREHGQGLLMHEMVHGVEHYMKRDGLHPSFPLTHRDWEDKRFQRIGVDYESWTFETTPTSWWKDLRVRIRGGGAQLRCVLITLR